MSEPHHQGFPTAVLGALITLALGIVTLAVQYVRSLLTRSRAEGVTDTELAALKSKDATQAGQLDELAGELEELRGKLAAAADTAARVDRLLQELTSAKSHAHADLYERLAALEREVSEIRGRCDAVSGVHIIGDTQGIPRARCAPGGRDT